MCGCSHRHQAHLLVVECTSRWCLSLREGRRAGRRFPTFQSSSFPRKPLYRFFSHVSDTVYLFLKNQFLFPSVSLTVFSSVDLCSPCLFRSHFLCVFPSPHRRVTLACKHILQLSLAFSFLPVRSILSLMCVLQRVEIKRSLWVCSRHSGVATRSKENVFGYKITNAHVINHILQKETFVK